MIENLVGERYNKLLVVEQVKNEYNESVWKCQCDCGKTVYVKTYALKSGHTKSCGCLKIEKAAERGKQNALELAGQRFGKLVVVEKTQNRKNNKVVWLCKCDCGNYCAVYSSLLTTENTKSCGCYKAEKASKDISGQRFGRLLAIEPTEKRSSTSVMWTCQCDCGAVVIVSQSSLSGGLTRSCGCYKKDIQAKRLTTHGCTGTKEFYTMHSNKRREKEKKLDTQWTLGMEQALRKFQPYCVLCGSIDRLATDHVRPLSKGNGLKPGNVVILCKSCNSKKSAKELKDLPKQTANILLEEATHFKVYWEHNFESKTRS